MGLAVLGLASCNSYLDTMPDNRAEIDSPEKVRKLLVTAYPSTSYIATCEISSDNVDYMGASNPYGSIFSDQLFNWEDVTEFDNDGPRMVWSSCYTAISSANHAIDAINALGSPQELRGALGEALLCRAYSHFLLVNMFSLHYSEEFSENDLGIHYMIEAETTLDPKYERESVKSNYTDIENDIEEGLKLIKEASYDIPKYHFNVKAAYAFATRFYLYKGDMDKVIEYASEVLGAAPLGMLRDNAYLATLPQDGGATAIEFVSPSMKSNLLLLAATSNLGYIYGPYYTESRYTHNKLLTDTETYGVKRTPWKEFSEDAIKKVYHVRYRHYGGTNLDKVIMPRNPFFFEYTDPVAGVGYRKTVFPAFTTDEALLSRAEAYVRTKQYGLAVQDINLWLQAYVKDYVAVKEDDIVKWAQSYEYYTPNKPTPKKALNPDFTIEQGKQEEILQYVLYLRRFETLQLGLRWFDIKRYGMTITRRLIEGGKIASVLPLTLEKRDNRFAFQLPSEVITAGMTPNPR